MENQLTNDQWFLHLPEELRESFTKAQVRSQLNNLNDNTPISQDLASVYLNITDATLKRMRASGKGPEYVQAMSEDGATSRNNKVLYTVGALKQWIEHNKTKSTGHAAIRRGLMFTSLQDALTEEPWWQHKEQIVGHSLSTSIDSVDDTMEVVWLTVLDALKKQWIGKDREIYSALVRTLLTSELEHIKVQDEAHTIEMHINNK